MTQWQSHVQSVSWFAFLHIDDALFISFISVSHAAKAQLTVTTPAKRTALLLM